MEHEREATDRLRAVRLRRTGSAKHPSGSLVVPTWAMREATKSKTTEEAFNKLSSYEFHCEVTSEGLLYRPVMVKRQMREGW